MYLARGQRSYRGMDSWLSEALKKVVQPKAAAIVEKAKAKYAALAPIIKYVRVEQPQAVPETSPAYEPQGEGSRLPLYLGIAGAVLAGVLFLRGRR